MEGTDATEAAGAGKSAYLWEVPGRPVAIAIDYDVIDRIRRQVCTGLLPGQRRRLERGGILLGSIEAGDKLRVRIRDIEAVPSSYEEGPSYVVRGQTRERFSAAVNRWRTEGGPLKPVGFFRGHTRPGLVLDANDHEVLDRWFPEEGAVALLVKPFTTRAPVAGFFFRENGAFRTDTSYKEFPFRREELGGGTAGKNDREADVNAKLWTERLVAEEAAGGGTKPGAEAAEPVSEPLTDTTVVPKRTLRLRGGWVWIPLSFIFLLLGTIIGFQVALSVTSSPVASLEANPFDLRLTATPSAGSIHLQWDRHAPAITGAKKATLFISEGGKEKAVELDAAHLRNGSVVYRKATGEVTFRLDVVTSAGTVISQTVEFRPRKPQ